MDGPFASFVSSLGSTGSIHFKSSKRYPVEEESRSDFFRSNGRKFDASHSWGEQAHQSKRHPAEEASPSDLFGSKGRKFDASRSWGEQAHQSVISNSESEGTSRSSSSSSRSSASSPTPRAAASAQSAKWDEISTDTGDAEGFSTSAQANLAAQGRGSSRFATQPTATRGLLEPGEIPDPFASAPAEIFVGSRPRGLHRQGTASGLPTRHGSIPPDVEKTNSDDESDDDSVALDDEPFKPFFAARREVSEEYPSYDQSHAKTRVREVTQTQFQPEARRAHVSAATKFGGSPSSPLRAAREEYFAAQTRPKPADAEPAPLPRRSSFPFDRVKEVVRGKLERVGAMAKGASEALRSFSPKPRSFIRRRSQDSRLRRDDSKAPFAQTPPQMPAGDKPIPTPPKEKKDSQPPRSAKAEDHVRKPGSKEVPPRPDPAEKSTQQSPRPGSKEQKASKESSPRPAKTGAKERKGSKEPSPSSPRTGAKERKGSKGSPDARPRTPRTPFKDMLKTAAVPGDETAIERLDEARTPRTAYEAAQILGLEYRPNGLLVTVSASDLRSAYRRAALRWHPDRPIWVRAGEDGCARATAAFHRANVAHDLLQSMAEA